jgi:hypothetical protein
MKHVQPTLKSNISSPAVLMNNNPINAVRLPSKVSDINKTEAAARLALQASLEREKMVHRIREEEIRAKEKALETARQEEARKREEDQRAREADFARRERLEEIKLRKAENE